MPKAKYDRIGIDYNETRKADPFLAGRMQHHLQANAGNQYLDIGCGTGNYTIALHQNGLDFIGVDPSERMLTTARAKCSTIDWRQGTAEAIPLADESVDGALASLTIHHWSDLSKGFGELYRVLRPGTRFVLFTTTPKQTGSYWLRHYFPRMIEDSCANEPPLDQVLAAMAGAGFQNIETEKYFVHPEQIDLCLYAGKDRPELYLDPRVRRGISSFADLANQKEIDAGLAQLAADIDSGRIASIVEDHRNELGDYMFVVAEKNE